MKKKMSIELAKELVGLLSSAMYKRPDRAMLTELVSNAWDADATKLVITTGPELTVVDNGTGMTSEEGVRLFWTAGSTHKRTIGHTPMGRPIIGQFGLGKFACLGIAKKIIMMTKSDGFEATTSFDLDKFMGKKGTYEEAIDFEDKSDLKENGTKIILSDIVDGGITTGITVDTIRKKFSTLLTTPDFKVYVDQKRLEREKVRGRTHKIHKTKGDWEILGEVQVSKKPLASHLRKVGCKQKGVTITKSLFDLETKGEVATLRMTGWVNADFLPVTTSRDDFVETTEEYQWFYETMREELSEILDKHKKRRRDKELEEAVQRDGIMAKVLQNFFKKNPEFRFKTMVRTGEGDTSGGTGTPREKMTKEQREKIEKAKVGAGKERRKYERTHVTSLDPEKEMKKLVEGYGFSYRRLDLKDKGEESLYAEDEGMLYLNETHPLYIHAKKKDILYHEWKLVAKQIVQNIDSKFDIPTYDSNQSFVLTQLVTGADRLSK